MGAPGDLPQLLEVAKVLVPSLALLATAYELVRKSRVDRAILVVQRFDQLLNDKDVRRVFRLIERGPAIWDAGREDGFATADDEAALDRILTSIEQLLSMRESGLLTERDLDPVRIYIDLVRSEEAVQSYLRFLARYSVERKVARPFARLSKHAGIA